MSRPLIIVVGTTASGKSALAVELARKFSGEIISADSRQVYRGMDIGSGKVAAREQRGIPHHCLDIADPHRTFTVAQYRWHALRAITAILKRGKIPILCGGAGLYIQAVLNGTVFPAVKPNAKLRHKLEQLTNKQLFKKLQELDPERAAAIDARNPHRLIRAIEIAAVLGHVPKQVAHPLDANMLFIGIAVPKLEFERQIRRRLTVRLRKGMVAEVRHLHADGISWKRLEGFGLEYRHVARFLKGSVTRAEMEGVIIRESLRYAKRQLTWWKHDPRIRWVNSPAVAIHLARAFLHSKKTF